MARVTVEDCVIKVPNRFELVMVSSQRARDIGSGAPLTVEKDNDKNPVIALREIADETVSIEELQKSLVMGLQKFVEVEEPEDEEIEIMAAEKELSELDKQFASMLEEQVLESLSMGSEEAEEIVGEDDDSVDEEDDGLTDLPEADDDFDIEDDEGEEEK